MEICCASFVNGGVRIVDIYIEKTELAEIPETEKDEIVTLAVLIGNEFNTYEHVIGLVITPDIMLHLSVEEIVVLYVTSPSHEYGKLITKYPLGGIGFAEVKVNVKADYVET
jgi:hypothetical protein